MRKWLVSLLLIAGALLFAIRHYVAEPLYHAQAYVFGTLVDINLYGESDQRAQLLANHIFQQFEHLQRTLHAWKPLPNGKPSELGAINLAFAKGTDAVHISPDIAAILRDAQAWSLRSERLFNPAIGHLIEHWGFQRDEFGPVDIDAVKIQSLLHARPEMSDIVIQDHAVFSQNPHVKLDLGGYAKGYALDWAVQYLRQQHVKHALINIGGNIIAIGQHGSQPWRVGIQHPRKPGALAVLDLPDGWAIGTSGDYQRYFVLNQQRYCHIIDPRSGYPVQHTQAVTVLIPPRHDAGVLSDVGSKPIFIAAPSEKIQAAKKMGITYFLVIDRESNITLSEKLARRITWLDAENLKQHTHVNIIRTD